MDRDYNLLGVRRNVTDEKLKQAFRKKAMEHHPDRVQGASKVAAEAKFKQISQAYQNIVKHRKEGGPTARSASSGQRTTYRPPNYQTQRPQNVYGQGGSGYYQTGRRGRRGRTYGQQFYDTGDQAWWSDVHRERQRAAGAKEQAPWMKEFLKEEERRRSVNAKWTRRAWMFTVGVTCLWMYEMMTASHRRKTYEMTFPLTEAWFNPLRDRWEKPSEYTRRDKGNELRYKPVHMVWDPEHPERYDPKNTSPPDYSGLKGVIAPGPAHAHVSEHGHVTRPQASERFWKG